MPMFDDPGAIIVIVASGLMGLAIGIALYVFGASLQTRAEPAMAESRRHARRGAAIPPSGLLGWLRPYLAPIAQTLPMDSMRQTLAERYARAGWPGALDDDQLWGLALLVGLVAAAVLMLVIALVNPLFAPAGLLGALIGPGLVSSSLDRRGKERERAITRTMPFVLDLLVLTMRAGAPLTAALERVASDYARHPIGAEFKSVLADLDMGVTTAQAFTELAQRVPTPDIETFVDDLLQAEELGRPLAEALDRLATRTRSRRVQDATETAGRAKVLVLVPGMLVFIATLLILFSPFVVRYFYGGYASI